MKPITIKAVALALAIFSSSAMADKITISGEPIVVQQQEDYYVPSTTTTTTTSGDYYYYSFGDTKRVCYKEVQPGLAKIDAGIFKVKLGADTVSVHCYNYSPDYFVVQ